MKLWQQRRRFLTPAQRGADRQQYERQLAWAAGTESFQHRDPLYHVNESFMMQFDAIGRKHAAEAAGEQTSVFPQEGEKKQDGMPDSTDTSGFYERRSPQEQGMLRKFSETAFQRGTLSGAVLQGTGSMMLFSCLKKTIGQSQPNRWQQRKLFETGSLQRNIPAYGESKMIYNRGFADSAVALVVNTLRDARRNVEDMTAMVRGETEMGQGPSGTLRTMYPFLDDSRERMLLQEYREKQAALTEEDPDSRAALESAIIRTEALLTKKAQMKNEFINKLRFLSDRATEALDSFTEPGFTNELSEALENALPNETPPPEEPGEELPPEGEDDAGDQKPAEAAPTGESAGEPTDSGTAEPTDSGADPQR